MINLDLQQLIRTLSAQRMAMAGTTASSADDQ